MPTYVTLYKWTDQGIKNLKGAPARIVLYDVAQILRERGVVVAGGGLIGLAESSASQTAGRSPH